MFFIYRRTYTATAGFSSHLDYVCALCGARAVASVQAQGTSQSTAVYGVGGSADRAAYGAHYAAQANGYSALQHAPCPRCGGYQPVVTSRFAAFGERVAKAKKRALPIAGAVAGLALLLSIVPAVRDLKYSSALLVTVVFGVLSLFGILYAILRAPGPRPRSPWANIHFWWGRHDGSVGWTPPPHVPPPALPPPTMHVALSGTIGGLSAFATIVALIVWTTTFEKIYVVDFEDRAVVIDGVVVTSDASTHGFDDKHVRSFEARTGRAHEVTVGGVKYALTGMSSNGWVVAPEARKNDLCFAEYEGVYGGSDDDQPTWSPLELDAQNVMGLKRSYDDAFRKSPKTQSVEAGNTVRRWSIRTVSCESLEEERKKATDKGHFL